MIFFLIEKHIYDYCLDMPANYKLFSPDNFLITYVGAQKIVV